MIKTDTFYFSQANSDNTIVSFEIGEDTYQFDSEIKYIDAIIFPYRKLVFVLHCASNNMAENWGLSLPLQD